MTQPQCKQNEENPDKACFYTSPPPPHAPAPFPPPSPLPSSSPSSSIRMPRLPTIPNSLQGLDWDPVNPPPPNHNHYLPLPPTPPLPPPPPTTPRREDNHFELSIRVHGLNPICLLCFAVERSPGCMAAFLLAISSRWVNTPPCRECLNDSTPAVFRRLAGLVVRRPPREWGPGFHSSVCRGYSSRSGQTSDFKIGTPVVTLPGAWSGRVSAGTGWPSVSIL